MSLPEEHNRELLLAGLAGTGKTSYLALLYLALMEGATTRIALGGFTDDREYLNQISEPLLGCLEAVHTEVGGRRELALSLSIESHGSAFLRIPDLSGETWEQAVHERRWDTDVESRVAGANGALIFVHVDEFDSGVSIAAGRAAGEALLGSSDASKTDDLDVGYLASPAQVELVDIVQLLCEQRVGRPQRTSIILSAWDRAPSGVTPAEWLSLNAPLADQYLKSNTDWLEARIWGVSAQGGSFRDDKRRLELAAQSAVERALVVEHDRSPGSIEDPVLWSLGITT
jgi:hypothetical protein